MQVDVSIVIVNYNTKDLTLQCLASIFEQTNNLSFEVIVVDNASTDNSCKAIADNFSQVRIICSEINLGFGKANNLGAGEAAGNFLLLLNSDTLLVENSVKKLKEFFERANDPNMGAVGCNLVDVNLKARVSYGNFPSVRQEIFEYGLSTIFRNYYHEKLSIAVTDNSKMVKRVDYISGACMFFKAGLFHQFGGFDEDFFLYYEETELCFRLAKGGYKIIWYPGTSVIHLERASGQQPDGINYWILEKFYESKHLYYRKCHGNIIANLIKYASIPKTLRVYRKFDTKRILRILLKTGKVNNIMC